MAKIVFFILLFLTFTGIARAQDASILGPATNNQGAASTGTLNILQPANPSQELQSADANSGGISVPSNSQNLQQTGSSDQIKVFMQGEGEGSKELESSDDTSSPYWVLVIPVIFGLALWWRTRRKPKVEPLPTPEPASKPKVKPKKSKRRK